MADEKLLERVGNIAAVVGGKTESKRGLAKRAAFCRFLNMAANIGTKEIRKRLIMGVVSLAAAVGVALLLKPSITGFILWVAVFVLFWMAGLGLFQAKEKT